MADNEPQAPTWFDEWSARTPIFSRYILILSLTASLACWFAGAAMVLVNCGSSTVFRLQFWRLFIAPVIHPTILSIALSSFAFITMAPKFEKQEGSTNFLCQVLMFAWVGGVVYLMIWMVFRMVFPQMAMFHCSSGLGLVWFGLLALECAREPERERKLLCFPIMVKQQWFPLVLLGLFTLISGPPLDLLASVVLANLYVWGYVNFLKATPEFLARLEGGMLAGMTQRLGYITTANAGQDAMPDPERGQGGNTWVSRNGGDVFGRGGQSAPAAGSGSGSTGPTPNFAGSGHTLGGSSATSAAPSTSRSHDKTESTRAAVLAAVERRLAGGTQSAAAPPTSSDPPADSDLGVLQLTELGFDAESARKALRQTNGDVTQAAVLLSSS